MKPSTQTLIRFIDYRVSKLIMNLPDSRKHKLDDVEVSFTTAPSVIGSSELNVKFDVIISNPSGDLEIELILEASFETSSDIDHDFIESEMVRINVPAIVFPYIRAYISVVTSTSGNDGIILPTFNFAALNPSNKPTEEDNK